MTARRSSSRLVRRQAPSTPPRACASAVAARSGSTPDSAHQSRNDERIPCTVARQGGPHRGHGVVRPEPLRDRPPAHGREPGQEVVHRPALARPLGLDLGEDPRGVELGDGDLAEGREAAERALPGLLGTAALPPLVLVQGDDGPGRVVEGRDTRRGRGLAGGLSARTGHALEAHRSSWERRLPRTSWERLCPARIDRRRPCRSICGRDARVPRMSGAGAALIPPNRGRPREPIPQREKVPAARRILVHPSLGVGSTLGRCSSRSGQGSAP